MTNPIRLPHSDPAEPQGEATAYVHAELTPEERAAFEAHLPTCEACRAAVEMERKLAPVVAQALAARPVKTGEEYLAMADAAQAKLDAEEAKGRSIESERAKTAGRVWPERRKWAPYWPWLVASAAAASVAVVVAIPSAPLAQLTALGNVKMAPGETHMTPAVPLAVTARIERHPILFWKRPALVIEAPRERDDSHVEIAAVDAKGKIWEIQSSDMTDPSCENGCGPLEVHADPAALPAGPVGVVVLVGPTSFDRSLFRKDIHDDPHGPPPIVGERAVGKAEIAW